jgi:formylglycine-generating enzyme required for sulfatase activity
VWEWTSSPWRGYPLTEDIPGQVVLTPRGPAELVVIRGASFFNDCSPLGLGVTSRVYSLREYTGYDIGFRVCALETGQ